MAGHILIVEDDPSVREAATFVLERAGFTVTGVGDGEAGLRALAEESGVDLVLLDLMLPSRNGFDVCREIRRVSGIPIVMLTARTEVTDVVAGLELGADDYITKPFVPAELSARVRAVLRRSTSDDVTSESKDLRGKDIVVDEAAFRAFRAGEEIHLTTIEFRLLAELVRNAGNVLTRETLLERVWGYDYLGDSRLVDMAVNRLRGKLGAAGESDYVTTVRGVGYRFERE